MRRLWGKVKRFVERVGTLPGGASARRGYYRTSGSYIDWKPGDPYPTGKETYTVGGRTYPVSGRDRTFPDEVYEEWRTRLGKVDSDYNRGWYAQDKKSRGLMTSEEEKELQAKFGYIPGQ